MNDGELPAVQVTHRDEGERAIGELDFHHAGRRAECRQRLAGSQHVDEPAADRSVFQRRRRDKCAVRIADVHMAEPGDDHTLGVGNEKLAVG